MFITHNLRTVVTSTQLWLISLVERVLVHVLSRGIFAIGNTWVHSTAIHNPKSIAFIKSLSSREIFLGDLNLIFQQFDYTQVFRTHIFCTCLNHHLVFQNSLWNYILATAFQCYFWCTYSVKTQYEILNLDRLFYKQKQNLVQHDLFLKFFWIYLLMSILKR